MENLPSLELSTFGKPGRCYGALLRIRGQAYVLGFTERGIFYRFGVKINEYKTGKWEGFFGLRTAVGIANLMIRKWMKNDVVVVRFRGNRVRGSLHFSHTGIISFIGGSLGNHRGNSMAELAATIDNEVKEGDIINGYES